MTKEPFWAHIGLARARLSVDLGIEPPNPASEIASLIERGEFGKLPTLRELIDQIPSARNVILGAAFRALGARKFYWEKGNGGQRLWEPDYKVQLDAVKWLAGYSDGLPAQTNVNLNIESGKKPDGQDFDLERELAENPAARERMRIILERSEKRALPS